MNKTTDILVRIASSLKHIIYMERLALFNVVFLKIFETNRLSIRRVRAEPV